MCKYNNQKENDNKRDRLVREKSYFKEEQTVLNGDFPAVQLNLGKHRKWQQ